MIERTITENKSFILTLRTTKGFAIFRKIYVQSLKNLQRILKILSEDYVVENIETCNNYLEWDKNFIQELSKDSEEGLVT